MRIIDELNINKKYLINIQFIFIYISIINYKSIKH